MRARLLTVAVVALTTSSLACHSVRREIAGDDRIASPTALAATPNPSTDQIFMCPMDKDIRSHAPGMCPRCGMTLVTSIPEPAEYHLDLTVSPAPVPGARVHLRFDVSDPWKGNPVTKFAVVHEKLFHAFVVSRDMQFFVHGHPEWRDGSFHDDITFPRPGMYRVLGDFYPEAATPQLLTQTVFVAGEEAMPTLLTRDYSPKRTENLRVEFSTSPEEPIAGTSTRLRFSLSPGDRLQKLLGAWGHMLAASDDLIDMMHTHPSIADGRHEMQFDVVFPRARIFRVWVQFQRDGIVNTAHFDVPVGPAPSESQGES